VAGLRPLGYTFNFVYKPFCESFCAREQGVELKYYISSGSISKSNNFNTRLGCQAAAMIDLFNSYLDSFIF